MEREIKYEKWVKANEEGQEGKQAEKKEEMQKDREE